MYSFSMYFNHHNSKVQKNALLKITKCNQTNYLELCNRKNEIKELKTNLNEGVNAQQIKILEMKVKDLHILYLDEISKKD
jgi:alanine dehydrogenase